MNRTTSMFLALAAGLGASIGTPFRRDAPFDPLDDSPAPKRPRPDGADRRDELAAEAKRQRKAAKARRDAERRDAGIRATRTFAPIWVESNGLYWISVAEPDDDSAGRARIAEIETKEEPLSEEDNGDPIAFEIFIYDGDPESDSLYQILTASTIEEAKRLAEEAVVAWGLQGRCA